MTLYYALVYCVEGEEFSDAAKWIEHSKHFDLKKANEALIWCRNQLKETTLTKQPIVWKIRKVTSEFLDLKKGHDTCNRTACQTPLEERRWWNTATEAFYCQKCMMLITQWPENANIFTDMIPASKEVPAA